MKKIFTLLIALCIVAYIVLINASILKYEEMDFNKNGFVEFSEAFYALDVRKRDIERQDWSCTEFFSLKDGLNLFDRCDKLPKADLVIVSKSKRELYLLKDNKVFRTYNIALGANPKGHKVQEGDKKTPEGDYMLDYKKPNSAFFKAIHISYPNQKDIKNAHHLGVDPGGFIMIHGQKNYFGWLSFLTQKFNWTNGCIALTNQDMEEVWQSVDVPIPIKILP